MIYLEEQLCLIRQLHELRGPIFDVILRFLNHFDTFAYYTALASFIWVGISWRWGVRIGFLLVVNGLVNTVAKMAFVMPRPYIFDEALAVVKVGGCGFPSGGAQTAMLFAALLVCSWKSRWAWPIAAVYVLLISFSRVALGVHFVTDVLGGWVFGLLVAGLFFLTVRPLEEWASRHPEIMLFFLAVPAFLAALFLSAKLQFLFVIAIISAVGVYISTKYGLYIASRRAWYKKILHGLVAVGGAGFLGSWVMHLFPGFQNEYLVHGVAGALWVSLLASPFCKKLFS